MQVRRRIVTVMVALAAWGWCAAGSWANEAPQAAPPPPPAGPALEQPEGPPPRERGERQRPPRREGSVGMGEGPRGDMDGPGPDDEITAEQIDEALLVLRDFRPEMASRIEEWRRDNPDRVGRMIAHQLPGIRRLIEARRTDPEGYKLRLTDMQLERQTRQLSGRIGEARAAGDAAKADDLTRELRVKVAEHFEVRQKMRERALVMLEQRIDELRKQLETRQKSRDALIEDQVKRLLPSAQGGTQAEW